MKKMCVLAGVILAFLFSFPFQILATNGGLLEGKTMNTYNQKSGSITGTWDANSALNLNNSDLSGTWTTGVTYTFNEDQEVEWVKVAANSIKISLVLYNAAGTKLLQHDFTSAEVTVDKNTTPKVNLGTVHGVRKVVLNNLATGLISVSSLDLFKGPPVPTGLNGVAADAQVGVASGKCRFTTLRKLQY